ncbi:N-terminal nucleophile aminohydrolase [Daldinia sp. FL1419]|nr:N-terminal nucleophile aminohydrolase [Daldinia sp. FL1419]
MDPGELQDNANPSWDEDDIGDDDVIDGLPCITGHHGTISHLEGDTIVSMDGAMDRWGKRKRFPVAAIFIHAGAGYHSVANEGLHMEACSEAARRSIKLLRSGHSAVDAVEAAIKTLEDKEITNAGYGSNLAIDGTVECDATLVDHFGRSGACGAVPNIRNPISLAKMILLSSNKPLSLRRVPPNLLIGEGAKEFAQESGMLLVPNQWLVSRNARDRHIRWQEELRRAEGRISLPPASSAYDKAFDNNHNNEISKIAHPDHTTAILTGTWNEGQPDSPASPSSSGNNEIPVLIKNDLDQIPPKAHVERSPLNFLAAPSGSKTKTGEIPSPAPKRPRFSPDQSNESLKSTSSTSISHDMTGAGLHDGTSPEASADPFTPQTRPVLVTTTTSCSGTSPLIGTVHDHRNYEKEDKITDTVGAIAIDMTGKIAAGSSSGGIGMKHRGRIGPAALVGIGTAVVPIDDKDQDGVAVAAVASGTGEHMATTMASQKCAERIYQGTRRGPGGRDVAEEDESSILQNFIANDFQEHPGVKYSPSTGAIGVMAVKKGPRGYYLYFAHNTDSFALASMGSNDIQPACVMSRGKEGSSGLGRITQGGRKIHL